MALLASVAVAQTPCKSTAAYEPCDIDFELTEQEAARHPNPYLSVEFRGEFRAPKGDTYRIPGFWDGGRRFKLRFSPLVEGAWDFRVISNIERFNGQTASFAASAPTTPGFVIPFNVHQFRYSKPDTPHLWMGDTCYRFATIPLETFRQLVDIRAAQKFNHLRGLILGDAENAARVFADPDRILPEHFQGVDKRVRYMNQKGITYDLILAGDENHLEKLLPNWKHRERYVRYLVARYAAMNITWQGVQEFEEYRNGAALLKEIGDLLKQLDPYRHPRSSHTVKTSSPLAAAGWMNYVVYQASDPSLFAVERQQYAMPFVNTEFAYEDSGAGKSHPHHVDIDEFRHRLWNAAISGNYVTFGNTGTYGGRKFDVDLKYANSPGAQQMTHLYDFFAKTRYWDLEPYFRVDGGRALALEEVEYIVYLEKPQPVDIVIHRAGYQVSWFNPATGEYVNEKDFKGERYTAKGPPDPSHDWVLYIRREGKKEGMLRSYKLESRTPVMQTVEVSKAEVPFQIQLPAAAELTAGKPIEFNATLTKKTRSTQNMTWLWTGEVAASGLGFRVLGTSQFGQFTIPVRIATEYPATLHVRLAALDSNGKIYAADRVYTLKK